MISPGAGFNWLYQALRLMLERPLHFLLAALLAPTGTAVLLSWPLWDTLVPVGVDWLNVLTTVLCYGFPLTLAVSLACGFARATKRGHALGLRRLMATTTIRVLLRTAGFALVLLLQGYLLVYLIYDNVYPSVLLAAGKTTAWQADLSFGAADTLLGTQLGMVGGLVLVLQFLFAVFVIPLHLFREIPLSECWRLSFFAIQLNLWLLPVLGLVGLVLVFVAYSGYFSIVAQILAFPLPAYLGALLYVAWLQVFQGGKEEEVQIVDKATSPRAQVNINRLAHRVRKTL